MAQRPSPPSEAPLRPSLGRGAAPATRRARLGEVLLSQGAIDEIQLAAALAEQTGLPLVQLSERSSDPALLRVVDPANALLWQVLPLQRGSDGSPLVAVADPFLSRLKEQLAAELGEPVGLALAPRAELLAAVEARYTALEAEEEDLDDEAPDASVGEDNDQLWLDAILTTGDKLLAVLSPDTHSAGGPPSTTPGRSLADLKPATEPPQKTLDSEEPGGEALADPGAGRYESREALAHEGEAVAAPPAEPQTEDELQLDDDPNRVPLPDGVSSMPALAARLTPDAPRAAWLQLIGGWIGNAAHFQADQLRAVFFPESVRLEYRLHGAWAESISLPDWAGSPVRRRLVGAAGLGDFVPAEDVAGQRLSLDTGGRGVQVGFAPRQPPVDAGTERLELDLHMPRPIIAFDRLGFTPDLARRLRQWTSAREGLLLVVGRRDSGRSTTLRSLAHAIGAYRPAVLLDAGDPVDGASFAHVPRDPGQGIDAPLEAALAHDPHVLLVDDVDSVAMASRLAELAGRQRVVIASAAGRDAADLLGRWRREGVPDTLLADRLLGIVEQRLIRTLCPACRTRGSLDIDRVMRLGLVPDSIPEPVPRRGPGCLSCHRTGFGHRRPLATRVELPGGVRSGMPDDELRRAVARHRKRSAAEIGVAFVVQGLTSLVEVEHALA